VDRVSLDVRPGEFVAIVGPSGCGKTTFLNAVDGLLPISGGTLELNGTRIARPGPDRAMVFQQASLLPWRTVLGNVVYGLELQGHESKTSRIARGQKFIRLVGLAGKLDLPVLTLIDSPGADGTAAGEAAGVGAAIAGLLQTIAAATVPILSVTIGERGSGRTLALAAPDNLWITPDGYFSVIAPESATAILKRPPEDVPTVAKQLRLAPQDLQELGIVRGMLEI